MKWRRRFEVVALGTSGSAISQRSVISEHRSERDAREAAGLERRRLEVIRAEEAASWSIQVVRGDEILHEERPFDGHREDVPVPPLTALHIRQADEAPAGPAPAEADAADPTPTGSLPAVPDGTQGAPEPTTDAPPATATDAVDTPEAERIDDTPEPPEGDPRSGDLASSGGVAPAEVPDFDLAPEYDADASGDDTGATGRVARPQAPPDRGSGSRRDVEPPPSGPVPDDIIKRFEESIARERARNARR